MNNKEYLELIKETYDPETAEHILFCMVGVAGEAGEIANMCQKAMRGDFNAEDLRIAECKEHEICEIDWFQRKKLICEMGGVFYFLHALCWKLGVSPEDVMYLNKLVLMQRKLRGTIRGDGDGR